MRAILWQEKHIQVLLSPRFDFACKRLASMNRRVIQNDNRSLGDALGKVIDESNREIRIDVLLADIRVKVVIPCQQPKDIDVATGLRRYGNIFSFFLPSIRDARVEIEPAFIGKINLEKSLFLKG